LSELSSIREIEEALTALRHDSAGPDGGPTQRTSSMTHIAWVPARWVEAATGALVGLAERHPSRSILLFPEPDDERDVLEADVDLRCYVHRGEHREVCSEVIEIHLCGARSSAPASVVEPLLLADLPVFLRWRGPVGRDEGERELIGVVDRLIVDSSEWPDLEAEYGYVASLFDEVVVSDIAWARTRPWRVALAALWPDMKDVSTLRVAGPEADGTLLARWLSTRLDREVTLTLDPAGEIELVEADGVRVEPARRDTESASDLLSEQLDLFGRDRVYEAAVRSVAPAPV
jgi:glucose-6-phosphate dehydrogenase assembly protein OpcA